VASDERTFNLFETSNYQYSTAIGQERLNAQHE